jgi:guanylate kinase
MPRMGCPPFYITSLVLVSGSKKIIFLKKIYKNIYKFTRVCARVVLKDKDKDKDKDDYYYINPRAFDQLVSSDKFQGSSPKKAN